MGKIKLIDELGRRIRKSVVPGEYHGEYWLLKRDDPCVWFGTTDGIVVTGTVLPGGDLDETEFLRPFAPAAWQNIVRSPFRRTRTRELFTDHATEAQIASANVWPGKDVPMMEFAHPQGKTCVAAYDPEHHVWVVPGGRERLQ